MDHESASSRLVDYARGRLESSQAAELSEHVRSCAECGEALETARRVDFELGIHGAAMFGAHPDATTLARYVLASDALDREQLAAIAAHLRACPTCSHESQAARKANEPSWLRGAASIFSGSPSRATPAWLSPALAVLAVAMIYPSYVGLVRYPHERAAREHSATETETLRQEDADLRRTAAQSGHAGTSATIAGGARALLLSEVKRGPGETTPTVTLRATQAYIAVLIDYNLAGAAPRALGRTFEVRILHPEALTPTWRYSGTGRDLWDARNQLVSLLIPTAYLTPGAYRLEIREIDARRPSFTAHFAVAVEPGR